MELATALDHKRSPLARARLAATAARPRSRGQGRLTEDESSGSGGPRLSLPLPGRRAARAPAVHDRARDRPPRGARDRRAPRRPAPVQRQPATRLRCSRRVAAAAVALTAAFVIPGHAAERAREAQASQLAAEAALPKPWQIHVDVLNGNGDIVYTVRSRRASVRSGTTSRACVARIGSTIRRPPCTTSAAGTTSPHASRASSASGPAASRRQRTRDGSS